MKKLFIPLLLLASTFIACETEVDVNADYQDITTVFAILDRNDATHYFKINKAFLGAGNAFGFAMEPDSLYYSPERINAKLYAKNINGDTVKTIPLTRIDTVEKEPGTFAYPNQFFYVTNEPLNKAYSYHLEIEKVDEGEFVTAETPIVGNVNVRFPGQTKKINPAANSNKVRFDLDARTRTYQLGIRFNYSDEDTVNNFEVMRSVEYILPSRSKAIGESEEIELEYNGAGFLSYIGSRIPTPSSNIIRHAKSVDYKFYLASSDFQTYLDLNGPSDGIVQERPEFSNIENGIGLFASRNIAVGVGGLDFIDSFRDSLLCSDMTSDLMFTKYVVNAAINGIDTITRCDQ
ncbi:MAG: hypothetical protein ACI8ZO_001317 [Flavobacteriales bacterium]|jgi:hypothetical protein